MLIAGSTVAQQNLIRLHAQGEGIANAIHSCFKRLARDVQCWLLVLLLVLLLLPLLLLLAI